MNPISQLIAKVERQQELLCLSAFQPEKPIEEMTDHEYNEKFRCEQAFDERLQKIRDRIDNESW